MKGNMICASFTVNGIFHGSSSAQPPASSRIMTGAMSTPSSAMPLINTVAKLRIRCASSHADLSPSVFIFCENTVTNAVLNAPSANRSRSMFGVRKATMKQSRTLSLKSAAKIMSRISPSTRLHMMASATMPVVFADAAISSCGGGGGGSGTGSDSGGS